MHLIYKCESSGVDCAYGGQLPARPCIPAFHEAQKRAGETREEMADRPHLYTRIY